MKRAAGAKYSRMSVKGIGHEGEHHRNTIDFLSDSIVVLTLAKRST